MGKTDDLHERLEVLECEFVVLLHRELVLITQGGSSRFLTRKISHVLDGKAWLNPETAYLEHLELEIRRLRIKLFSSDQAGVLMILTKFLSMTSTAEMRMHGGESHAAKVALKDLETITR